MATYGDAIKEHARIAVQIYKSKLPEIEKIAGFMISPDGSNTACSCEDVKRYLQAIQSAGGMVGFTSAKMVVTNAIHKAGLPPVT
ncbi:MAG: hypothetical protein HZB35_07270 [Nitrospirae bacterium]|nr:hypothetical protein [Nitrospirota bacterium]